MTPPAWVSAETPARRSRLRPIHVGLFFATLFTTTLAGSFQAGVNPFEDWRLLARGLPFSATLMGILLVHEMGHFVMSRIHGVEATPPYFIPGPPFLVGTFGAFIRMHTPTSRKALFDVGAAGPWAGFLVAIPAVFYGLTLSEVRPLAPTSESLMLGESMVFVWLARAALGVSPSDATILLHPIALAGWFGLFVTFLNLLPIGQLDGGHVVYALLGRRHRLVARAGLLVIVGLAFLGWQGWVMWAILVTMLGLDHPSTIDDTPLDPARRVAAWLTIALFGVTFMPVPIAIS
ncbi:MAG: site-2 protease family protein [Deltaproteobacteria bacterium]|nr:site-2 protease family protein [Deltaproteobacteria bacterium]